MSGRIIAMGDVHGCARALTAVIEAIQPQPADQLIILGDYLDRGPDSRQVVNHLLELRAQCQLTALLGNHERMLLHCLEDPAESVYWLQYGGQATMDSYGGSPDDIPPEHLEFLRQNALFLELERQFFVHANYLPELPLAEQPESYLLWMHLHRYLPPPHGSGKLAVVGHTPQVTHEILDLGHLVCLDTYCFGGGWLTAMDVETRQCWQADRDGNLRPTGREAGDKAS